MNYIKFFEDFDGSHFDFIDYCKSKINWKIVNDLRDLSTKYADDGCEVFIEVVIQTSFDEHDPSKPPRIELSYYNNFHVYKYDVNTNQEEFYNKDGNTGLLINHIKQSGNKDNRILYILTTRKESFNENVPKEELAKIIHILKTKYNLYVILHGFEYTMLSHDVKLLPLEN